MRPNIELISKDNPIIAWWSGGITSAVACWIAIQMFGSENVRVVFIDTHNEDTDTYRFMYDCENWYRKSIESTCSKKFRTPLDVWMHYKSLNVATGAICSTVLKREVREEFQKTESYSYGIFGFDIDESKRAKALANNHPDARPLFPLLNQGLSKKDCFEILPKTIKPPLMYELGFHNNNCFKTGCVQGGIGYWQKMRDDFPAKFESMALVEHELTNAKGSPVTMLKDQSKNGGLVFLMPHPKYPDIKDISMMKGRMPKPLMECNGLCGTNLFEKNETEEEINFEPA